VASHLAKAIGLVGNGPVAAALVGEDMPHLVGQEGPLRIALRLTSAGAGLDPPRKIAFRVRHAELPVIEAGDVEHADRALAVRELSTEGGESVGGKTAEIGAPSEEGGPVDEVVEVAWPPDTLRMRRSRADSSASATGCAAVSTPMPRDA